MSHCSGMTWWTEVGMSWPEAGHPSPSSAATGLWDEIMNEIEFQDETPADHRWSPSSTTASQIPDLRPGPRPGASHWT